MSMKSLPPEIAAEQRRLAFEDWLSEVAPAAYKVDFYQAMRRIASAHPQLPPLGEALRPKDEPVRVSQPPELDFAPATRHAPRRHHAAAFH
jgi:predicted component of type VI protein secretion system